MTAFYDTPYTVDFQLVDQQTQSPIDISAWTFEMVWKRSDDPHTRIVQGMQSGISLNDPTNGIVRCELSEADVSSLCPGTVQFWLYRTDGQRTIILYGDEMFEWGGAPYSNFASQPHQMDY